jgi:uncharacterized membrane protein
MMGVWKAGTAAKFGALFGGVFGVFGVAAAGEINGSVLYIFETMVGGALLFAAPAMIRKSFRIRSKSL